MTEGNRPASEELNSELRVIIDAVIERNARDPVLLDLRGLSDATDWFVIASGDSDTHARAIADNVLECTQRAVEALEHGTAIGAISERVGEMMGSSLVPALTIERFSITGQTG